MRTLRQWLPEYQGIASRIGGGGGVGGSQIVDSAVSICQVYSVAP